MGHPITDPEKPGKARVVVAFILDLVFSFFLIGYAVALVTGGTTGGGFALTGLPAIVVLALWIAYMVATPRLGERVFQRLLKAI